MICIAPLMLGTLSLGLSSYMFFGVLPAAANDLDVSLAAAGQAVTVFTLAYAVLSPLGAALLAGRPTRTVSLTLALFASGNAVCAIADSVPLLLAGRVMAGAGAGVFMPVAVAAAAELVPAQQRGRALALMLSGLSIAATAGASLAQVIASHWGWRATQWIVVATAITAMASIRLMLPHMAPVAGPSVRARFEILADRRVLAVATVTLLCTATSTGTYTYLSAILGSTLGATSLGLYLLAWGVGGVTGNLVIGTVADRFRDTRLLVTLILAMQGTALILLPAGGQTVPGALALLFIWGVASWAPVVPQQHRLLNLAPASASVAVSANSAFIYLGNAIGAFAGGLMLQCGWAIMVLPIVFGAAALLGAIANLRTAQAHQPVSTSAATDAKRHDNGVQLRSLR